MPHVAEGWLLPDRRLVICIENGEALLDDGAVVPWAELEEQFMRSPSYMGFFDHAGLLLHAMGQDFGQTKCGLSLRNFSVGSRRNLPTCPVCRRRLLTERPHFTRP